MEGSVDGSKDGLKLGDSLGMKLGSLLGVSLGVLLGTAEGNNEGTMDGTFVGLKEGQGVGVFEGDTDGIMVGGVEGADVGCKEGMAEGCSEGVGLLVGAHVLMICTEAVSFDSMTTRTSMVEPSANTPVREQYAQPFCGPCSHSGLYSMQPQTSIRPSPLSFHQPPRKNDPPEIEMTVGRLGTLPMTWISRCGPLPSRDPNWPPVIVTRDPCETHNAVPRLPGTIVPPVMVQPPVYPPPETQMPWPLSNA
jgi:hypothetical protein